MKILAILFSFLLFVTPAIAASHSYTISVSTQFTALHTYFLAATGCNDSNAGTSAGSPWCTLNTSTNAHSIVCGDAVIAAPGAYDNFLINMQPTGCPSSSGGIDGTGGIYAAVLLCNGLLGQCTSGGTGNGDSGSMSVQANYWSVQGWVASNGSASSGAAFGMNCGASGTNPEHHVSYINDIGYLSGVSFNIGVCAGGTLDSFDYFAVVGSLANQGNGHSACVSAFNFVTPRSLDSTAGTHIYADHNYGLNNPGNSGCGSDGNGMILDSPDISAYSQQVVFRHNIIYKSRQYGIHIFSQENTTANPIVNVYNNTTYGNGNPIIAGSSTVEEMTQWNNDFRQNTYNNIARTDVAIRSGADLYAFIITNVLGSGSNTVATVGGTGKENVFYGLFTGACGGTSCAPASTPWAGVSGTSQSLNNSGNFYGTDPAYRNVSDLSNWTGNPSCGSFENVTQCMGYDAPSNTVTTNTPIYDLEATCGNCSGKGYQLPTMSCVSSSIDTDFPVWLKGIVYLHWTGSIIEQRAGLASVPCGM